MNPEYEQRFYDLMRMKGRRKLKRYKNQFRDLPDPAKELFLQIHGSYLFSESPCQPSDFLSLLDLGYTSYNQVNNARIPALQIIEFGLKQEYVPFLKKFLHPRYVPDAQMLEAFKSGNVEEVSEVAEKNIAKSHYRYLPI